MSDTPLEENKQQLHDSLEALDEAIMLLRGAARDVRAAELVKALKVQRDKLYALTCVFCEGCGREEEWCALDRCEAWLDNERDWQAVA